MNDIQRFPYPLAGIVVDNADPLKKNRVRVRVPMVYGTDADIADKNLPWAIPSFSGPAHSGMVAPIKVGSGVIVVFMNGEKDHPIVLGGFPLDSQVSSLYSGSMNGNTPKATVVYDTGGFVFVVDEKAGSVELTTPDGVEIKADSTGKVSVKATNVDVTASGQVKVIAPIVTLGEEALADRLVKWTEFATVFDLHVHPGMPPASPSDKTLPPQVPISPLVALLATVNTKAS